MGIVTFIPQVLNLQVRIREGDDDGLRVKGFRV